MKKVEKSNHALLLKNITLTVLPATIFPFIDIFVIFNQASKILFTIIAISFIIYLTIKFSIKEEKENLYMQQKIKDYEKYCIYQKLVNSISETEKIKRNMLKCDLSNIDINSNILLYSPHQYIENVCINIKSLISNITDISLSSFSVSFIYQYPTCHDCCWQWITRKEGTINQDLNNFVTNDNSHSYFHYLVCNNLSSHFENDKRKLITEGNYWISENDMRFSHFGSIASYKISFNANDLVLCNGYLTISTYGRKFVEDEGNQDSINNFNILLSDTIIPPYRNLLESELGLMYERHIRKNI